MSLFQRKSHTETRALSDAPFNIGGTYQATDENALRLVPVYAAIARISDTVSSLPVHAYRETNGQRVQVTDPALVRSPALRETFGEWVQRAMVSLLLHGNAFGFVLTRDGFGYPTQIEWLDPNIVTLSDVYRVNGQVVPRDDILHIKWVTLPGSSVGYAPLDVLRLTVQTGVGSMKFGADWFSNGGVPPGTFSNTDKTLTPEEANATAERLRAAIKRGRPLVYGKDWQYNPIAIPPEQAQFVQTNKMTATQVASVYAIPPTMIGGDPGGTLTYSSPEQNSAEFVTHCLRPWTVRLENAISALLPNNVYVKFNFDALLRPDTLARMQSYAIQRQIGLRNVDELRALEDLAPLPNGAGTSYEPLKPPPPAPQQPGDPHAPAH